MKRPASISRKQVVKQLDTAFSIYVRQREADHDGITQCFTCDKRDHWKRMHAGHFQSRAKYATRWDEQNVQTQCPACNLWGHGEQYRFGINLDAKYGMGTTTAIVVRSNKSARFSTPELQDMVKKYRELHR